MIDEKTLRILLENLRNNNLNAAFNKVKSIDDKDINIYSLKIKDMFIFFDELILSDDFCSIEILRNKQVVSSVFINFID